MPTHDRNDSHLDRSALRAIARASNTGFVLAFLVVVGSLALQAANLALPYGALPATPVPIAIGIAIGGTLLFAVVLFVLRRRIRRSLAKVDRDFADITRCAGLVGDNGDVRACQGVEQARFSDSGRTGDDRNLSRQPLR